MLKTFSERGHSTLASLLWFIPAGIAFLSVAFLPSPWSLPSLLVANTLTMVAVCCRLGFVKQQEILRCLCQRGLAYLFLLTTYTAFAAVILGYPLQWLGQESSLGAALAVSASAAIALLGVWRVWPAFGFVFVWKAACSRQPPPSRISFAAVRSIRFAWSLTADNELFFSHGLVVAVSLLALTQGALSVAGVDAQIPHRLFLIGLGAYALILSPLAQWLIAGRCADALLVENRRVRNERAIVVEQVDSPAVETLLDQDMSADLNPPDMDAMLLRCARAGQTKLALAALDHGADPNGVPAAADRDQRSVLVLAALSPDLRLLRGLIARKANLNHAHAGLTPLIAATRDSYEGRPDAVMTLLTNGADPRCTDADGNTPLHFAVLAERPIVAALLCDGEASLNAVNRDGQTPLCVACTAANWKLVRFLLDRGAGVEVAQSQPALLAAASTADDDNQGIRLLLKRRARVDARGALDRTALMIAALHGNAAIVQSLLDAGAQVDLVDVHGVTALMEAARSGAHEVLDVLATRKPMIDLIDVHGRSALMIASQSKQASEETIRRLLAMGAARGTATADGRKAVDFAAANGRWNIVAMLDPQYPLPATHAIQEPMGEPCNDSPEHLLDALRFSHWNIVESFTEPVRTWPQSECARIFAELITHTDPAPRYWLLNHGLDANAVLADGQTLFDLVLAQLPASLAAAMELLDAGAQPGGSDALARVCVAFDGVAESSSTLETFSLALLERGAEAFAADMNGRNPLTQSIATGNVPLTRALLARGIDPQARDDQGRTPLFAALHLPLTPALTMIQSLLRAGADPETQSASGETPLGLALTRNEPELQRWLNWPAWKLPRGGLRASDLVAAAACGDTDAVGKLLALGLPIAHVDAQGATALVRAAGNGHAAMVAYLLERGADPTQAAATGATALSAAVSARRSDVIEVLLRHDVAVDQRLTGGGTALMIAAALGHADVAAQLLAHGADANVEDQRGERALHAAAQYAFQNGDGDCARQLLSRLLEHGAQVDARNLSGQTALLLLLGARVNPGIRADQMQLSSLLSILLNHHADLNVQDQRGVSALHACAIHGLLLPARALLAAGADPERRDTLDRTPREIAHLLGFIDVATELGAMTMTMPAAGQILRTPAR